VWLLIITVAIVAPIVVLTGGRFSELANLKVNGGWMLAAGLGIQVALEFVDLPKDQVETLGYGILMVSYALLLAFCLINLRTTGFGIITAGIAMNALVIGLNQGMPTVDIGNDAQGKRVEKPIETTVKHRPERDEDLLKFLDDRIILPEPFDTVISAGDIVMSLGICELVYFASRRRRRRGVGLRPRRRAARAS
jgi:hypothetical protein